jgi:hypothetical protein
MNFLDCSNRRGPRTTGQQSRLPIPRGAITTFSLDSAFPPPCWGTILIGRTTPVKTKLIRPSTPQKSCFFGGMLNRTTLRLHPTSDKKPRKNRTGFHSRRCRGFLPGHKRQRSMSIISARVSSSRSKHDLNRGNSKMGTFRMLGIGHSLSASGACSSDCPSSIRLAAGNSALTQTEHEHE